jgi:hypothetical protein
MSRSFSKDYENNLIAIEGLRFTQIFDIIFGHTADYGHRDSDGGHLRFCFRRSKAQKFFSTGV